MYPTDIKEWLSSREQEEKRLYHKYGSPLELDHAGEFVAISADGQIILDEDPDEVLRKAVKLFGSGTFALRRVGEKAFGRWLNSRQS